MTVYGNVLEVLSAASGSKSGPPALKEAHAYLQLKSATLLAHVEDYSGALRLLQTTHTDQKEDNPHDGRQRRIHISYKDDSIALCLLYTYR